LDHAVNLQAKKINANMHQRSERKTLSSRL